MRSQARVVAGRCSVGVAAWFLGTLALAPAGVLAEATAAPAAVEEVPAKASQLAAITRRMEDAEHAVRTRTLRTRSLVAAGHQPDAQLAEDALHLRRLVRFLAARFDSEEEGPEVTRLRKLARALEGELGNLDRYARGERPRTAPPLAGPGAAANEARGGSGGISGRITALPFGSPLYDVGVDVYDTFGFWWGHEHTDLAGNYTIHGLPPGTYVANTHNWQDYVNELYDDLPCGSGCDVTTGTPISVTDGAVTTGIDFALQAGGVITGRVREAGTGVTLGADVYAYDANGSYAGFAGTDAAGRYRVRGLETGIYYISAQSYEHVAQLYDGIDCLEGYCDPLTGDPVQATVGQTTAGIDFALHRRGAIAGTITDAETGEPLAFVEVDADQVDGFGWEYGYTDENGQYAIGSLDSGAYRVRTFTYEYRNELYDDVPCSSSGCPIGSATPVSVEVEATTPGIDFALDRLGSISGTITEAGTGGTIDTAFGLVWDTAGFSVGYGYADSTGSYRVEGLFPGTYFVTGDGPIHQRELYDGLPCPEYPGVCDPTTGDAIAVALGAETGGVDFALAALGQIHGRVTDAMTGLGISSSVSVWSSAGYEVGWDYTDSSGYYEVRGLETGIYYLHADGGWNHAGELYDDVPCADAWDCDLELGTPVPAAVQTVTAGIDFALERGPGLAGTVTAQGDGSPLPGVGIDVWLPDGQLVASTSTDAAGRYFVYLDEGSYLVSTDAGLGGIDEVFDDEACPRGSAYAGLCDPLRGSLVEVTGGLPATADFVLSVESLFADGFETGDVSAWSNVVP